MTGTDHTADGRVRARENVVHEIGLCQGALGILNTFIVAEDEVNEFSNIAGLTQIRFKSGDIMSVENRVVAALKVGMSGSYIDPA